MTRETFDVAVIGGGVVGCAVARRLRRSTAPGSSCWSAATRHPGRCQQGEQRPAPHRLRRAAGQPGARLHAGRLSRISRHPREPEPAVARDRRHGRRLDRGGGCPARRHRGAGASGTASATSRRLDRAEVLAREPNLAPTALGAACWCRASMSSIPGRLPSPICTQALRNGATAMIGDRGDGRRPSTARPGALDTSARARRGADRRQLRRAPTAMSWSSSLLGSTDFEIRPRKGQFVVFDKPAAALLRTIILPVPTERTKGVVLARTIFGNLLVGPTAEEQEDRDRAGGRPRRRCATLVAKAEAHGAGPRRHAGDRPLCRAAAGHASTRSTGSGRLRERLDDPRRRHPLDRADGGARPRPPCRGALAGLRRAR